jgi:hypothetical protein
MQEIFDLLPINTNKKNQQIEMQQEEGRSEI